MSFVLKLFSRAQRAFMERSVALQVVGLVLAGALAFFVLSLASKAVRSAYWGIVQYRVVAPYKASRQKRMEARIDAKQRALAERDAAAQTAKRDTLRQAGSLSSPYVEVGSDARFPLLVRVWLNIDPSHTARVANKDEDFPLVYERAVSSQGFVPIVGLAFGHNSFDIEIRDSDGKRVARHTLRATIEDKENIRGWIKVRKKAARNDFISVVFSTGPFYGRIPKQKYVNVIDDFGTLRWVYRWAGEPSRGRPGYILLGNIKNGRIFLNDDEGMKIVSVDVFGNRRVVFDGTSHSPKHDYKVHHDFHASDKGTMLLLADPIEKEEMPLPKQPKIFSEEDTILEIDMEDGKILREIDLKKIFADSAEGPKIGDQAMLPRKKHDWMHLNSIQYDSQSDSIVLSGRNRSAVFALDYDTGALAWLFADPEGRADRAALPFLEVPQGYRYHGGQHDAWLDGNRLRFFDNAVLAKNKDGSYASPDRTPSRIVEARLDLANAKITSLETYAPKNIFSLFTGGYDFGNGKYLICYCAILKDSFGGYNIDLRNGKGLVSSAELFEIEEGSDRELLHVSIKGFSYRPRYFDWQEMVRVK